MNTETALAHIEAYVAGGDELGEVSDTDALAALETLRNVIAGARAICAKYGPGTVGYKMAQSIDAVLRGEAKP